MGRTKTKGKATDAKGSGTIVIDLEELLAECGDMNSDGFSTADLREAAGIGSTAANRRLRDWIDAGVVEFAGKRPTLNICGSQSMVPVYRKVSE